MYFGAIQICGERLNTRDCKEFCDALDEHKIKMLALRECGISTKNFKRLMDSIGYCKSILHLNLSICGLHCQNRVDMLAAALNANNSLTALLLHGNHFGTEGMAKLIRPLIINSNITCLDVGDCDLGDKGLKYVCELLPSDDNKPGLQELVLSGNPNISSKAWEKFTVAVAASSSLKALYLDFNNIGETAGKMLVVAAAGHKTLNIIDLEACDLTEDVGKLLLFLLQHYPVTLTHVMLEENDITEETKYSIRIALGESESEESSSDDDDCLPIEGHPSFAERHKMDDRTHSQRCKRETAPPCLDKKKSEEDLGILTDIAVHRSREGRRQKSSNSGAGANQEEEIKYKIQLQEVSESSDITDNRNVDVTYEFKPTEKRFATRNLASYNTRANIEDSGSNASSDSILYPNSESPFDHIDAVSPHEGTADDLSETEIYYHKARKLFSR